MREDDLNTVYRMSVSVKQFKSSESLGFWTKRGVSRWIRSPSDLMLVAEEDKKIIGFLMCIVHQPTESAIIESIYVGKKHRRKGIGRILVEECFARLRKRGIEYLYAEINHQNKETIEFFDSTGFSNGYAFVLVEKLMKKAGKR